MKTAYLKQLKLANNSSVNYYSLQALNPDFGNTNHLPFSVKILLESLVRQQNRPGYTQDAIRQLARWPHAPAQEYPFMPARILLQDFTGVPCVVDLAALREMMPQYNRNPQLIEPQLPVDLVIDHSVQLDRCAAADALKCNMSLEFSRNRERYLFLRWGQQAFSKLRIFPPSLGICHQINMEYLAQCIVRSPNEKGQFIAYPDSVVGTDSHTVMVNSLGVLGWGVGGIEAEAAMLGQPMPLLTPAVLGIRLVGQLGPEVTATDLALTITELLRTKGVVGRFVEFFGPALAHLSVPERAPVANMAPEYGATTGFFPIDNQTLAYLRTTGRTPEQVDLVERYCKEQGLFWTPDTPEATYNEVLEFDLGRVTRCVAGPKRPQDRQPIAEVGKKFKTSLAASVAKQGYGLTPSEEKKEISVGETKITHGAIVIASITSCTNTASPDLMIGAALVAKKAVAKGLTVPGYVKTSLAPGSRAVANYLQETDLLPYLEKLGFNIAAYGCATCIGNSGPIDATLSQEIRDNNLVVAAVLSGNRNFEGRVHPATRANYLASPALVVAYALRGTVNCDILNDPIGNDKHGQPVYLRDIWPSRKEIASYLKKLGDGAVDYATALQENELWNDLPVKESEIFPWDKNSTYIRQPPYFANFQPEVKEPKDISKAAVLAAFGDFITTDHISPAGSIHPDSPAGQYLTEHGVKEFNSYGARRGNHEVMVRGTFANRRLRNKLVEKEGGWTMHWPTGEIVSIYEAARRYGEQKTPLIILAGKMYGAGSSRDWAAKGVQLLGVRTVIAESFERIHRSNLIGMGVLPLEFLAEGGAEKLGLKGTETYTISGIAAGLKPQQELQVTATGNDGHKVKFGVRSRLDTPVEIEYYRHGGILPYVLRGRLG